MGYPLDDITGFSVFMNMLWNTESLLAHSVLCPSFSESKDKYENMKEERLTSLYPDSTHWSCLGEVGERKYYHSAHLFSWFSCILFPVYTDYYEHSLINRFARWIPSNGSYLISLSYRHAIYYILSIQTLFCNLYGKILIKTKVVCVSSSLSVCPKHTENFINI